MPNFTFNSLIQSCRHQWDNYIQHEFVQRIAKGTLKKASFQHYLKQDYLFLIHFSRAWGLAIYKSHNFFEIREALASLKTIVDIELELHIHYCQQWGISEHELTCLTEANANLAYTRYVLDAGQQGELLDLHVALSPCLVGYGAMANWINQQPWRLQENNPYQSWIDLYASREFQDAVQNEIEWISEKLSTIDSTRFAQLSVIFKNATRLEAGFWQMGLDLSY